jgi:uncharacterized protein (TIGR02217 family)
MAFHDVRLPDSVEQGATGGPTFQTSVLHMSSGMEQRNIDWAETRHEWDLAYGIDDKTTFDAVRQFFFARRGQAHYFRFKDWSDYQLVQELIGIGDAVNRQFQLLRTYEATGPAPYLRRITRPVTGTLLLYVNGVSTGFTDLGLGLYQFAAAPANGALVTATCDFDIPMRFNVDKFQLQLDQPNAAAIGSLPVIEVRE